MEYRIWDRKEERWVEDNEGIYFSPTGEVVQFKSLKKKPKVLDRERYLIYDNISVVDIKGNDIYEGSIVKCKIFDDEHNEVLVDCICSISFVEELASYVMLDISTGNKNFFCFGHNREVEVIGHIMTDKDLIADATILDVINDNSEYGDNLDDDENVDEDTTEDT